MGAVKTKKINKSDITALTRAEFEEIVYNGMLSDMESKVFELYIKNVSVDETADLLFLSPRQVKKHRKDIRKKLHKL